MGTKTRAQFVGALLLLLLPLAVVESSPAGATPAPSSPLAWTNTPNFPAASVSPVDDAAGILGALGRTDFASSFYDLTLSGGAIDLYMTDTTKADALVAAARILMTASSARVQITTHSVLYDRATLHAARDQILGQLSDSWRSAGVEIYGVATRADGTGLTIDTNDPTKAGQLLSQVTQFSLPAQDVLFQLGDPAVPTTRQNDYPPYAGGVYINTTPNHFCTTGFGMHRSNGNSMVTAAHCAPSGRQITDGGGDVVGTVSVLDQHRDAEYIPTSTWQGVFTINESYTVYKNWAYNYNGQTVCQSGFTLNQVCGIVVSNDDYIYTLNTDYGTSYSVEGVQAAVSCGNCASVGGGDSGGPVWVSVSGGVQSRGINSAGQGRLGTAPNGNPTYHTLLFTETGWILKDFGGSLLVG